MAPTSTATHLDLTVIRASEIKWHSTFRSELPNLYIQVVFGKIHRRTRTVKRSLSPEWHEHMSFELRSMDQSASLSIQIKHDSSRWRDKYLGKVEVAASELLNRCANGNEVELHLTVPSSSATSETAAILHLRLEAADTMTSVARSVEATKQAIETSSILGSAAASDSIVFATVKAGEDHVAAYNDLYQSVGKLVSKLDIFVGVIDKLSEVHPYVNFAWQVASVLYKTIRHQFKVDKKIIELVHVMEDAFNFVHEADFLCNKTQYLKTTMIELLRQTDECCLFIQEYARHTFLGRMLKMDVDGKLDEFMQSLCSLRQSIDSSAVIHIAFVSLRMSSEINTIFLSDRLLPDRMDAFNRPQCLPGTRTEIMKQVVEWALSDSDQNVFWLHGVAGSGKSTVSTTIAEHFRGLSRLGAHLFFERGKSDPSCVVRTLAYKLASFDSSVETNVIAAIKRDNDVAQATSTTQFENLLHGPLTVSKEAMHGPVVIVLDALDECGTEKTRRGLMESFRKGLPELPRNFRFLITSRKEPDINLAFSARPDRILAVELEHGSGRSREDVLHYLEHSVRNVFESRELPFPGDWQPKVERLAIAAAGLFIWASTAVKLVDCDNPARRLMHLVSESQHLSGLEQLYDSVLTSSGISFDEELSRVRFAQVLGLVLLSRNRLTDNTIDRLLGFSSDEPARLILSRLQSVLVFARGESIHFCHTSFRDYLLSPERKSDPWFIGIETQKELIASRCFDVMTDMLRFNICNIQSSYIPNDQIPDLPDRVKANIPPHLEYSCLFWSQHLHEVRFSYKLLDKLSEFLNKRLLYLLEVMSLLEMVNIASPVIFHAMNWVSSHNADTLAFLRDVRRMTTIHLPAISQSTPHIYLSVLLFASRESKFIARYLKPDVTIVQIQQTGVKLRSPLLKELTGHTNIVGSVAFSPDGTRIASGSWDRTVRIWDAESGRVISGPFKQEGHVHSVAFSPDGARVVSGSQDKSIRMWDVESGQMILGPIVGHDDAVLSVTFSPDGMHIVSGSADKTVMVWDVESRQVIKCFKWHADNVYLVAFSSDGRRIVSGSTSSEGKIIQIWDVESEQTVCDPLRGHAESVCSVAFSCDGTRIASGSGDCTIRIWDAESGDCISGPFEGHTNGITSVTFSPNGKLVASGSADNTVRVWDVESGRVVSGPFQGHTHSVMSVAFSPDGSRVVSGSWDNMIRIWDAESVQTVSGDFEGHTDTVSCVAFLPNGKRIVSGSHDFTIRIWDTESGRMLSRPFKGHSSTAYPVAFSPDGGRVASRSESEDCTICVWDAESGNMVSGPFEGHTSSVNSICFSPDGTRVVSGSRDSTVRIWDVESGKAISGPFRGHSVAVFSVAFSPHGRSVVSGSDDPTIIIWDVESGEIISGPLRGHKDRVESVAFSPDSTRIVSGSWDRTILIWDVENGQVMAGPFEGHTDSVWSVAFSPDGARIVSGSEDRTIRVWDARSGEAIFAPFEGHTGTVESVSFSPDGKRVVSGSGDRTIRIWNVEDPCFDWTMDTDGWIHGRNGELLVWVPPDLRTTLWRPQSTAMFSCAFSTKLDFTKAALGEQWQECFEPSQ